MRNEEYYVTERVKSGARQRWKEEKEKGAKDMLKSTHGKDISQYWSLQPSLMPSMTNNSSVCVNFCITTHLDTETSTMILHELEPLVTNKNP